MVVEYMFNVDQKGKLFIPWYIKNFGHWHNVVDETFVGWVEDKRNYYVPDSLVVLSKTDFVNRALRMHAANPLHKFINAMPPSVPMTEEEVIADAQEWYDDFVLKNTPTV